MGGLQAVRQWDGEGALRGEIKRWLVRSVEMRVQLGTRDKRTRGGSFSLGLLLHLWFSSSRSIEDRRYRR